MADVDVELILAKTHWLLLPAAVLWYCAAADLDVAAVAAVDADALSDEAAQLPRDVVNLRQLAPPALVVVVAEERLQQVSLKYFQFFKKYF